MTMLVRNEHFIREDASDAEAKKKRYVHAKCNQEGGAGESQIAEELEKK
jgi:hypothetical protein